MKQAGIKSSVLALGIQAINIIYHFVQKMTLATDDNQQVSEFHFNHHKTHHSAYYHRFVFLTTNTCLSSLSFFRKEPSHMFFVLFSNYDDYKNKH